MDPKELRYTKDHEWVAVEGDVATVGITDYAQKQLGAITFVEMPQTGNEFKQFSEIGVVESVKTASDIYAPVTGNVIEVNEALNDTPELVNQDPLGDGWIYKISITDSKELGELLSNEQYQKIVREEEA